MFQPVCICRETNQIMPMADVNITDAMLVDVVELGILTALMKQATHL